MLHPFSASWSRHRSRLVAGVSGLAVAAAPIGVVATATPANANPAGTGLVISEVYGGGGNSGGVFRNDFIELYNPTGDPIALDGLSLQYRSAAGNAAGTQTLAGSVPAQSHWLVQEALGANTSQPALPTPDATGTFAMSGTGGQVLLINGTGFTGSGDLAGSPGLVDMVGWGTSTTSYETAAAPATTNATSMLRGADGTDTDNNSTDFAPGAPDPQNSGGTVAPLSVSSVSDRTVTTGSPISAITLSATGGIAPYAWSANGLPDGVSLNGDTISGTPPAAGTYPVTVTATDSSQPARIASTTFTLTVQDAQLVSIAEIQGTDTDTSPLSGQTVTTQGVVTAAYGTGGFNGFFLETGGAGGSAQEDATPGASDAVFVFGSASAKQVHVGESVQVTGQVAEFDGETEVEFPTVTALAEPLPQVAPDALPWSDLDTNAEKEAHEGELVMPQGEFTVSDNFDANFFGSFTLASGDHPLVIPTEVADAQDPAAVDAVENENAARQVTLDDGASINFNSTANKGTPLPWLTPDNPVRIGSTVRFHEPLVLDYRFDLWNLQPTAQVTGDGHSVATFSDTRVDNLAPRNVGGDLRLATFNVLNYFPTTGEEYVASGLGTCSYFDDREGTPIGDNVCEGPNGEPGPRGAATEASLQRQQAKIVTAINGLGANIVSLEELENSAWFGKPRDYAIGTLVDALNADAGSNVWAYAPSPAVADLPPLDQQDVIRTGFIYKPADVSLVGPSHVLTTESGPGGAFSDAREPLAQAFKRTGASDDNAFLVVVNHFKSKGSGVDDGTGQGAANPDRIAQANALTEFAAKVAAQAGTDKVFFTGDFNAYSKEDPVQVIEDAGYTELNGAFNSGESTYSFDGMEGSLDHVFANQAALAWVTGVDVWQINAQEQVGFEYSRYNYNATLLYQSNVFRASDHNPEIVGLDLPDPSTVAATTDSFVWNRPANIGVTVSAAGDTPTGTVTMYDGARRVGQTQLSDGAGVIHLPAQLYKRGTYRFTLVYSGDDAVEGSSAEVTFRVTNPGGN